MKQVSRSIRRQFSKIRTLKGSRSSAVNTDSTAFYGCGHPAHQECKNKWESASGHGRCPLCNYDPSPPSQSADATAQSRSRASETSAWEEPPYYPSADNDYSGESSYGHGLSSQDYHPSLDPLTPRHPLHGNYFTGPAPPPIVMVSPELPGVGPGRYHMMGATRFPMIIPGYPRETRGLIPGPFPAGLPFQPHQFGSPSHFVMMHPRRPQSQSLDEVAPQLFCLLFLVVMFFYFIR